MLLAEQTPDGQPRVWLLYRPEPFAPGSDDDRAIHLWVRRCDVFTTRETAQIALERLIGEVITWSPHELFPELLIGRDVRGNRWLLEPAPVNPGGVR